MRENEGKEGKPSLHYRITVKQRKHVKEWEASCCDVRVLRLEMKKERIEGRAGQGF